MSFNTTPYLTADDAEAYFLGKFSSESWDDASEEQKTKALIEATNRIDRLNFTGLRTADYNVNTAAVRNDSCFSISYPPDGSPGQVLEFPRNGNDTVPQDILAACCEIAYALLDGIDPEIEMQNANTTSQRFSALAETYDADIVLFAFKHGIPSLTAWNYLVPYLADPFSLSLKRI